MYSNEESKILTERLLTKLKNYESDYRVASRHRNAAALVDFTRNLLSIVGGNKGLQYGINNKPRTGTANKIYEEARERYRNAIIDYNGHIAALKLKESEKAPAATTANNPLLNVQARITPGFSYGKQGGVSFTGQRPLGFGVASGKNFMGTTINPYWYSNKKYK